MNPFEELYNSTIKIVPYKPKEYSEEELINEERTENGTDTVKEGGFIDLNIPVNTSTRESYKEYEKIDPIAVYRNKMSLKNVPYDVDKVNVLYNRTHPGSQSFTSWINNAEKKSTIESKFYRNFVRWLDNNARRSLWKEKSATGIQRRKYNKLKGIELNNVYQLIDFDYKIVWEYAVFEDGMYKVVINARNLTGDNSVSVSKKKNIADYNKNRNIKTYYRQYTEEEFYLSKDIEDIFLHPDQYEVVDREDVIYTNAQKATLQKLFKENDPRLPKLTPVCKSMFDKYVEGNQVNTSDLSPEEKKIEEEKKEETER